MIYCYFFSPCGDDSGRWGRGGLFTALEVRSDEPRKQYELAGKMKGECCRFLRSVEEMLSFCPSRARPAPREVWSGCRLRRAQVEAQKQHQRTTNSVRPRPPAPKRCKPKGKRPPFYLPPDLELGHVLLFPIDDKQSRPDGQDQVRSVQRAVWRLEVDTENVTLIRRCLLVASCLLSWLSSWRRRETEPTTSPASTSALWTEA